MQSPNDRGPRVLINRSALIANFRFCRSLTSDTTRFWPVVKSNGYGLGANELVKTLENEPGVDGFFVANLNEAMDLTGCIDKHPGCNKPVAVLHGFSARTRKDIPRTIIPVINHCDDLRTWGELPSPNQVIIHVDHGMNRLGLDPNDLQIIKDSAILRASLQRLDILFWMTHYSSSDHVDSPESRQQANRMRTLPNFLPNASLSMAASAGLFLPKDCHGDIVRPGIALHGGIPTNDSRAKALRPVITLEAPVLQIRTVNTGDSVGYGMTWKAPCPSRVATVAFGYADGVNRIVGNRLSAFFHETPCPVVGRISMDSIAVDVSRLNAIKPDDALSLINSIQTINHVAKACNTIPHEVLTSLGTRVVRQWQDTAH